MASECGDTGAKGAINLCRRISEDYANGDYRSLNSPLSPTPLRKRTGKKFHVESRMRRVVPRCLLKILNEHIPGFKDEKYAFEIAWMLWSITDPVRQHRNYPNALWLGTDELRAMFGEVKNFKNANRDPRCRYFSIFRHRNNTLSRHDAFTNGYEPTPWMQKALDLAIMSGETGELVDKRGRSQTVPSLAIRSTDTRGHALVRWRGVNVPSIIPVNTENLERLLEKWTTILALRSDPKAFISLLERYALREQALARARLQTQLLITQSRNTRHPGKVYIRYVLHDSGRLYAEGLNLQSCKREVRQTALAGFWDIDISTCHFTIMAQMAARFGYRCAALESYIANKTAVRREIAEKIGVFPSTAKRIINAIGYGARESTSSENAIPELIGKDRAKALYSLKLYRDLKGDVDAATEVILSNQSTKRGLLVNLANRAISVLTDTGKRVKKPTLMAHLLQGVEAAALEAAVRASPGKVLLLQHDGFTANEPIDPELLRSAVLQSTGFDLTFDVEKIEMPLEDLALESSFNKKFEEPSKASADAGFEAFWPVMSGTIAFSCCDVPPVFPRPLPDVESPF